MRLTLRKGPEGPGLPEVNLLSPWVFDALAVRELRRRFVLAGVVLALLIGAGGTVQHLRAAEAEQVLTIERAEGQRLTEETQALAPVRAFVSAVEHHKATVSEAMQHELRFSGLLEGLDAAAPAGVDVESASVTLAPPAPEPAPAAEGEPATAPVPAAPAAASPCPGPDPFNTRTVVGCVTLSGTAVDRDAVGDFVINLGDSRLFVEPFINTTTTADGAELTFTGSVGLSERLFTKRYADLDALLASGELR